MAGLTDVQIAQRACGLVGIQPISSFADGTAEANVLNVTYAMLVEGELANYPWRFAMKQVALDRLTDEPLGRYTAAYQMPVDVLSIAAVTVNDDTIAFDRYGSYIYCNAYSGDVVVLDYVFREDEERWPAFFTLAIVQMLAGHLAMAVQERATLAEKLELIARDSLDRAKARDAQGRTTRKLALTRIKNGRLGFSR